MPGLLVLGERTLMEELDQLNERKFLKKRKCEWALCLHSCDLEDHRKLKSALSALGHFERIRGSEKFELNFDHEDSNAEKSANVNFVVLETKFPMGLVLSLNSC